MLQTHVDPLWFDVEKSQSKIKIWSLLERETDSYVTGI